MNGTRRASSDARRSRLVMRHRAFRVLGFLFAALCFAPVGCGAEGPEEPTASGTRTISMSVAGNTATDADADGAHAEPFGASLRPNWSVQLLEVGPDVPLTSDQIELCKWPMIMSAIPEWQKLGWRCCDAWTAWVTLGIPATRRDCGCLLSGE